MSGKKRSEVWKYFKEDPSNSQRAICMLCKQWVSRGGKNTKCFTTSNMQKHIARYHSKVLVEDSRPRPEPSSTVALGLGPNSANRKRLMPVPDSDEENELEDDCLPVDVLGLALHTIASPMPSTSAFASEIAFSPTEPSSSASGNGSSKGKF